MRRMKSASWVGRLAAAVLLVAAPSGCGSRGLVPVEGRVTFAGKAPPAGGYVFFVPLDASTGEGGEKPRSGTALFMEDGSFTVTTFQNGDGLRPGRYEARIQCERPGKAAGEGGVSAVPPDFKVPEIEVPASGPAPCRVEIDVR